MTPTTTHPLLAALRAAGYGDGAPSVEVASADGAMCDAWPCDLCGHIGLDFYPMVRRGDDGSLSYRAVAVCPACGAGTEL